MRDFIQGASIVLAIIAIFCNLFFGLGWLAIAWLDVEKQLSIGETIELGLIVFAMLFLVGGCCLVFVEISKSVGKEIR